MSNILADNIKLSDTKAMYNEYCKELLSCKQILSRILHATTEEFEQMSFNTIQQCIEGTPEISSHPVYNDAMSNEKIVGADTVDNKPGEGIVTYDIRFAAYAPQAEHYVKLYVNVEAQKNYNTDYPLVTRGIYYGARMISSQYGVEFKNSEYGKIKKVYSIWICMKAPLYKGNTITKYSITKKDILGHSPDIKNEYDKMTIIFIYLNSDSKNHCDLTNMLNTIFSNKKNYVEKLDILKKHYGIELDSNEKEALNEMCNLAEGLVEDITEEVTEKVTQQVTKQVTQQVTERDIKLSAQIARDSGANEEQIPAIIANRFEKTIDEVMRILNS